MANNVFKFHEADPQQIHYIGGHKGQQGCHKGKQVHYLGKQVHYFSTTYRYWRDWLDDIEVMSSWSTLLWVLTRLRRDSSKVIHIQVITNFCHLGWRTLFWSIIKVIMTHNKLRYCKPEMPFRLAQLPFIVGKLPFIVGKLPLTVVNLLLLWRYLSYGMAHYFLSGIKPTLSVCQSRLRLSKNQSERLVWKWQAGLQI